jgi:hypothetical protein
MNDCRSAGLDSAVIAVDGLRHIVGRGLWIVEQQLTVFEKRLLVAFDGQHIVAAAPDDRFCGRLLAVHRIGRDDATIERQERQKLGQNADFVRLAVDLALPERQPRGAGEGTDQGQRTLALPPVEGPPHGLAVDRDHAPFIRASDPPGERCDVAREARLEGRGIEQPKHPRERVVARNTARQPQKPPQQRLLRPAEQRHVDTGLGAAHHRQERQHHDLIQLVPLRVAPARVHEPRNTPENPPCRPPTRLRRRQSSIIQHKKILQFSCAIPLSPPCTHRYFCGGGW